MRIILSLVAMWGVTSYAAPIVHTAAPGKGIIPAVYPHYKQMAAAYDFNNLPFQPIVKGVARRFVMGTHSTVVEWRVKAGATLPLHYHPHEQINWVIKGAFSVYSQNEKTLLKAGQMMVFPPYVPHQFVAMKDSLLIGFVSPERKDFLPRLAGIPRTSAHSDLLEAH